MVGSHEGEVETCWIKFLPLCIPLLSLQLQQEVDGHTMVFKGDAFYFILSFFLIFPLVGAAVLSTLYFYLGTILKNHTCSEWWVSLKSYCPVKKDTKNTFGRLNLLKLFTKILEQNNVLAIATQFLLAFIYTRELSHLFLCDRHICWSQHYAEKERYLMP